MMPGRDEVLALLRWAGDLNPGPWVEHSLGVARAAETIARACGMDAQRAWTLGALHDIGRFEGVTHIRHAVAGYRLMLEKGWEDCARVCLTHSFPDGRLDHYAGRWDVSDADRALLYDLMRDALFSDEERLIQLCDSMVWGEGVCLLERRIVDVGLRYGVRAGEEEKWRAVFSVKHDFEARIGGSIYALFPEAAETTFRGA